MAELLLPGERRRKNQLRQVLVIALLAGIIGGGVWYWKKGRFGMPSLPSLGSSTPPPSVKLAEPEVAPPPAAVASPLPAPGAAPLPAPVGVAPSQAHAPGTTPPLAPAVATGVRSISVVIEGPLERAIVAAAGREVGAALAQVVTRALVWWVDVPQDLLRNDTLQIVYETQPAGEPIVHAVRFKSSKTGQTHRAYRFKPEGSAFFRMYHPDGQELEMRLQPAPLDDYEQVTSLIRDGRRHKGVDFKAPVGTPVRATFNGTITRRNWNFRGNGNCLEVTENGGARKVFLLHLDVLPDSAKVGKRVSVGEIIANSGNTGRSFAPHLHYQLMTGDERVLDPFTSHKAYRRSVDPAAKPALQKEIARLDGFLDGAVAAH